MSKLISITSIFIIFFGGQSFGQIPNVDWTQQFGTGNDEASWDILTDQQGNYFTVTSFRGGTTISGQSFTQLGISNQLDFIISKFDVNQALLWQKHLYLSAGLAGSGSLALPSIKLNASGNLYICAHYNGIIHLDNSVVSSNGTVSLIRQAIFASEMDTNGNVLWARNLTEGTLGTTGYNSFEVTNSGEILLYLWGYVPNSPALNPITINNIDITSGFDNQFGNMFFAQFTTNGDYIWHTIMPPGWWGGGVKLANNSGFNSYFWGNSTQNLQLGSMTLPSTSGSGLFIGKANTSSFASVIWANRILGNSVSVIAEMETDASQNLYLLGNASSDLNFGNGINLLLSTNSIFLAKYDANGNSQFAVKIGEGNIQIRDSEIDINGNIYICGHFSGTANIGNFTFNTNQGNGFVAKYDSSGNCLWAIALETLNANASSSCSNLVTTGIDNELLLASNIVGNISLLGLNKTSYGQTDALYVKLSGCAMPTANLTASGSTALCNGQSVDISTSSQSGATYTWLNGGVPIVGQTSNTLTVSQAGNYSVIVSLGGACVDTSNVVNIQQANTNFTIGTNPANITGVCPGGNNVTLFTSPPFSNYTWSTGQAAPQIQVNQSGVYQVTITNSIGCTATSSFMLAAYPLPSKPEVLVNSGCLLACDTFLTSGFYKWRFNGNIVGGNSQFYDASLSGNGFYSVEIIDVHGCSIVSDLTSVNCTTSIEVQNINDNIKLTPNPNNGTFTISSENTDIIDAKLVVYNIEGQKLTEQVISSRNSIVQLPEVASGTYYVIITTISGEVSKHKIAVVK